MFIFQPFCSELFPKKCRDGFTCVGVTVFYMKSVVGAIFSLWNELKVAKSWEEVEQVVWVMG